jgi:putative FmdB family regulatory protein
MPPIYEYQCKICNHRVEKLQKLTEEPLKKCPMCEQESLVKVISAGVFNLKGNGFHKPGVN